MRKKRNAYKKEKTENDANTRLEQLVNEIVIKQREEKKRYVTATAMVPKDGGHIVLPPGVDFRPLTPAGAIYGPNYQVIVVDALHSRWLSAGSFFFWARVVITLRSRVIIG